MDYLCRNQPHFPSLPPGVTVNQVWMGGGQEAASHSLVSGDIKAR